MEKGEKHIREAHPLKQGLKQFNNVSTSMLPNIREAHPLKQGLKLVVSGVDGAGSNDSRGIH